MSRPGYGVVAALAVLVGAACAGDAEDRRGVLSITGDSIVAITETMHEGEVIGANCSSAFIATLDGEPGDSVTLHSGRISYVWEASGQPVTEYEWNAESIRGIWPDPVIRAGSQRESLPHGFGQSVPGQAVRSTVTFSYTRGTETEQHETEPFNFVCRTP